MHGHLVAVEVGVERRADQRVQLDGRALDQLGLEGLDRQAVQRRRAVQQHQVVLDHFLEHVPDFRAHALDDPLGRLDVVGEALLDQPAHYKGLEQLQRHLLGQAALVQLQVRPDHDHRAARVVHALAEQVLAEAALLALEHVAQALQAVLALARHRPPTPAVVDQRVDRLLEHALLVAHDDLGRVQLHQALQAVVAVDHPPVQVVQVAGREATAVELDHRAQVGRDDRQHRQDHPLRAVAALAEVLDHAQPLGGLLAPLALSGLDLALQILGQLVQVDRADDQVADRAGAHIGLEDPRRQLAQREAVDMLELLFLLAHQRVQLALQALLEPLALLDDLVLLALTLGVGQQFGVAHVALAALFERLELLVEQLLELLDHLLGDRLLLFDQRDAVEDDILHSHLAGPLLQVGAQQLGLARQRLALGLVVLADSPLGRDLGRLHAAQLLGQLRRDLDALALGLLLDSLALLAILVLHLRA